MLFRNSRLNTGLESRYDQGPYSQRQPLGMHLEDSLAAETGLAAAVEDLVAEIRSDKSEVDLRLGGQFGDSNMPIMMGSRNLQAVRVQVNVAGQAGQGEAVEIFVGVRLPEDQ